jgi:hypothetical protein
VAEGKEDGVSGDGGVGIGHVKDMMDEGRVEVGEELLVAAGDLWARGGGAELAIGLEAGAMLGGGGGGDGSGYVTAEDVVARERACGDDLGSVAYILTVHNAVARERTHLHDKRIRLPDARGAWCGEYIPTDSPPQRSSNNPYGRT